jgi:hypothetical protein
MLKLKRQRTRTEKTRREYTKDGELNIGAVGISE